MDINTSQKNPVRDEYSYKELRKLLEDCAERIRKEQQSPSDLETRRDLYQEHEWYYFILFDKTLEMDDRNLIELTEFMDMLFSPRMLEEDCAGALSALTLNIFKSPEPNKAVVLLNMGRHLNPLIRQRALVGIYLVLCRHEELLMKDTFFMEQWKAAASSNIFPEFTLTIIQKLQIALETKNVVRKIRNDLFPKIKGTSMFRNNRKAGFTILNEDMLEEDDPALGTGKNEEISLVENSLKEIVQMMEKGMDIHLISFQQGKNFKFFHDIENWFYPFTFNHSASCHHQKNNGKENILLLKVMLAMGNFCHSDRWSLVYLLRNFRVEANMIPEEFKNREIAEQILTEMTVPEDDKECKFYIEDLYRFFNLHPQRALYGNPFQTDLSPLKHPSLMMVFTRPEKRKQLAKLLYDHKCYADAIKLMQEFEGTETAEGLVIHRYQGYAWQQLGNMEEALKHYELCLDYARKINKDEDLLLNMARCYRKARQPEKALSFYEELGARHPDDLRLTMHQAECLIDLERYEDALKKLFKIEYIGKATDSTFRAIVWCCFLSDRVPKALTYWKRIKEKSAEDHLNAGHLHWVIGDTSAALTAYREFFNLKTDKEAAQRTFREEADELSRFGITPEDVELMIQAACE